MSGGESSIPTGPIKDRYNMVKSKPASTPTDKTDADIPPPPIFNPEDFIRRSFLMDEQEDGQKFRGKIVELIEDHKSRVEDNPTRIKFRVSVNNDNTEEIYHLQQDTGVNH
jgi:hypothetical protein